MPIIIIGTRHPMHLNKNISRGRRTEYPQYPHRPIAFYQQSFVRPQLQVGMVGATTVVNELQIPP